MSDFLLELRCEEIPARMQAGARAELEKLLRKELDGAGVALGEVVVWSTPRRLALITRGLPEATELVREEVKGPKVGAPPQALEGFLRKTGLAQDQLEDRGGTWFALTEKPGRPTCEVLAEAIPAIVRAFAWPKSMRWGAASLSTESPRWVRPLSGIVAMLGEDLVECEVGGIAAGYATLGHRFHHDGPITIGGAHDYQEKLRACHVVVDHVERQDLIRTRAAEAAAQAGLTLVVDEGLVIENAGLTEWPVPLLGRFDAAFLEVPPEVIKLTARTNQKYFVCEGEGGKLANAFVCTANIEAADGGAAIVDGNRKVLAARLSDARFFWEQDRRKTLEEHARKLGSIIFHEKLGTVADKVERVAKLARWLVEEGIVKSSPSSLGEGHHAQHGGGVSSGAADSPLHQPSAGPPPQDELGEDRERLADVAQLADWAEQAARLCKADLVTEMVGEFPELQGLMGGYYARAEGLPNEVADAIRDHYKPVGQGDEVPTAPVTVAVSLADRLDTLVQFASIKVLPTGSRDPFALRRAALGIAEIVVTNEIRMPILKASVATFMIWFSCRVRQLARTDIALFSLGQFEAYSDGTMADIVLGQFPQLSDYDVSSEDFDALLSRDHTSVAWTMAFLADRLKVQQREAGVRHDLIDAVFATRDAEGIGEDDLVRLLARVRALQAFVGTPDGANLLAGYKRAANILKKENYAGGGKNLLSYTPEPAERALIEALDAAEPRARDSVAAEDFAAAMGALASLRGPIDAFFDHVTVNDADPAKRAARLALLDRFRSAVHQVADFSRIEG